MLLRFGVSNHLSIRDTQELSFVASSLKDEADGLIPCSAVPSGSVLPTIVVYGGNASGKTNIVDALRKMCLMIRDSQTSFGPWRGVPRSPFLLDSYGLQRPSHFDIDFIIDGVRHHYGFETSDTEFLSEWLYIFPKNYRRIMFEREGLEFYFGRELRGKNNDISKLTRPNSLYLSAAAQNRHEQLSDVFRYFNSIHGKVDLGIARQAGVPEPDQRTIDFLEKIGTGVVGYRLRKSENSKIITSFDQALPSAQESHVPNLDTTSDSDKVPIGVELAHYSESGERVYFRLAQESAGTRRLLPLLGGVFHALDEGSLYCIDELSANLHTLIGQEIVKLFCSSKSNPNGAQLLATTHDTNLLNSRILRRDQLWFTEKDNSGSMQMYPLTDIRTDKHDNIEEGYLQGRFGAAPFDRL